jgi:hypothetical protein
MREKSFSTQRWSPNQPHSNISICWISWSQARIWLHLTFSICQFNPKLVRNFERACSSKKETDKVDASVIVDQLRFSKLPEPYDSHRHYLPSENSIDIDSTLPRPSRVRTTFCPISSSSSEDSPYGRPLPRFFWDHLVCFDRDRAIEKESLAFPKTLQPIGGERSLHNPVIFPANGPPADSQKKMTRPNSLPLQEISVRQF